MSHEGHDHGAHGHDHASGHGGTHTHPASNNDVPTKSGKKSQSNNKDETTIIVEEVKNGKRIVKSQSDVQVKGQKGQKKKAVEAKADSGADVDMVEDSPSPPKRAKRGAKA